MVSYYTILQHNSTYLKHCSYYTNNKLNSKHNKHTNQQHNHNSKQNKQNTNKQRKHNDTWFSTPKKARNPRHANHVLKNKL